MGAESHLVMLVDDEPNILNSLKRVLRKEGYEIATACSGPEALDVLANIPKPASVILSDFKMPEMNGVELLSHVRQRFPDTVRIILSGYADGEMIQSAVNEGQVYRFLSKPWDDDELKIVLRTSIEQYERVWRMRSVLERVNTLQQEASEMGLTLQWSMPEGAVPSSLAQASHFRPPAPDRISLTWQRIMDSLPVAVIGVDHDELIVLANACAERTLGSEPGLILGSTVSEALPAPLAAVVRPVAAGHLATNTATLTINGRRLKAECVALDGNNEWTIKGAILAALAVDDVAHH